GLDTAAVEIVDGTENSNILNWVFDSSGESFNYLASGETVILTYTIIATDFDNDGVATGTSSTETVKITITGTNDAPTINAIDSIDVDNTTDGSAITSSIGEITFRDVDLSDTGHAASVIDVTITGEDSGLEATDAELKALIADLGVTKTSGSSAGSLVPTFTADADLFDYLNFNQTVTLTYTLKIDDGDGGSGTQTFAVTITGSDNPPELSDISGALTLYTQLDGAQVILPNVNISDDGTMINGAKVTISEGFYGTTDVLNFVSQNGISGTFDAENGVLNLSGQATLSAYETALQSVTFVSTFDPETFISEDYDPVEMPIEFSTADRTFSFTVTDENNSPSNVLEATVKMEDAISDPDSFTFADRIPQENVEGTITGTSNNDIISNDSSHSTVFGGEGNDILIGVNAVDFLYGGAGNDFLFGGNGKDILDGGAGVDILEGGSGSDEFVFQDLGLGVDEVLDFNYTLDELNFDALTAGGESVVEASEDRITDGSGNVTNMTLAIDDASNKVVNIAFDSAITEAEAVALVLALNPTG
ncbi:MAG: VCBS domain-containing protein, partial [Rhizobiaceae bacterium]